MYFDMACDLRFDELFGYAGSLALNDLVIVFVQVSHQQATNRKGRTTAADLVKGVLPDCAYFPRPARTLR